ncbi:NAD(P)H-dependent oxidoreductase [Aquipseudomonas guryensis]|uniref:NAD(P)H-dependent oxidoreductase n=1 Tax=Aquipseudomonas guryensis TaxID=2759165 RepID=A0A7W4D9X5_9GAMM|nr:NAD(P)H-dependent oxidoreductase [Pseudomonas guryensis]MBB1518716.1 NAD(P)H-dependent oxidoreductase [Pseudomonas guryensis]
MNTLIIHAHPEPQSFCSAMKDLAVATLQQAGHSVQVSDLYAMNWNPVASATDFQQRSNPDYLVYALEQREALKTGSLAPDIAGELDKLLWADLLILNFPLFWCSVPAMLKGWIDRVLVSGICYGGLRFYDRGGLAGKRALLSFSLGGQAHMFADEDAVHGDLEPMLRPLQRGTLAYTGLSVLPPFAAYHVPYVSADSREEILEQYRDYLRRLDTVEPLAFPSLADFDRQLQPLNNRERVPA